MADEVKIIRLVIDSSKAVDGSAAATRALANIDKSTNETASALAKMETSLGRIGGLLKAQLALAVAEVSARLVQMATDAFKAASGLEELAEQMGITARGLQALQTVAVQNGASMEQLEAGIGKFSQKMGEAADGNKEVIDSLKALGVQNLDLQGKLRPTEDLLVDVAKAITDIDDPARRAAAAVDLFGKGGRALLPAMKDIAEGFDTMGLRAQAAGTLISDHTIKRLDEMADKMEVGKLKTRAFLAEGLVAISDWYTNNKDVLMGLPIIGSIITLIENIDKIGPAMKRAAQWAGETWADIKQAYADGTYEISGAFGRLLDTFSAIGSSIKGIFVNAMNGVIEAIEKGLNSAKDAIANSWVGKGAATVGLDLGGSISIPRIGSGDPSAGPMMTNEQYYRLARGTPRNYRQELQERRDIDFAQWFAQMETSAAGYTPTSVGGGTSTPKGGGGGKAEVDEIAKLIEKIAKDAEKAREAFATTTDEINAQNEILAVELRLTGALPEVRAHELAVLKATNEAKKAGVDLESDAFKQRLAAVETGERLRQQQDELKKATELWTAPLKSALESIQRIGADAFDKFLENGKFSFDELSKVFTTTIRRMAAEFLALATIRPVMSVLVNAISPSMASSMGLGTSGGGSLGGGGLFGGGLSNIGGSIGSWLSSPIFGSAAGPAAGMAPTGASGLTGGGFLGLGGTTWGQGLGALAGAGMGIYQLMSGGGSTSSMIGGISSIVGAGVSLIPGIGQIAGPAIALLGNLLPGLLGLDKPPTITNQEYGDLTYGSNGFFTSGGAWGPNANASNAQGALGGMGTTMQGIFNALGGVKDPSKVWGVALQNFSQQYGDKSSFSNQTSFLAGPNGERIQWGQGSTTADVGLEAAGLAAALKSIMGGAVGEISANLEKGLGTLNLDGKGTLAQLAAVVAEIKTFDDAIAGLGKTVTSAEQAILQIDQSFAAMYATAEKYGLPVGDVDAAKAKARLGVATDFGKSISRGILELTDPKAAALADLDDWRATMVDNNKWLLENVTGALDHINEIERLYGLKRAAIVEQGASQALSGLVDVIKRLTYGDLSGASPAATLSGLTGSFNAMLAQANAGDQTAIAGIGAAGAELAEFGKSYYGSATPAFQNLVSGIRGNLAGVYTAQGGTDPLIVALTTVSAQFAAAGQDNAELKADMAEVTAAVTVLTEKLQRMLDKMAA